MKSKGFTLVELLAVISILSLLSLITSMVVSNSLREAKTDLTDTQNKAIELATKAWGSDNINKLPTSGKCVYITLQDLIDDGFLESKVVNPTTKGEISTDLKIKITNLPNKKNLIYEVNSKSITSCDYIGNAIYVDLPKGLTPVIYDEDKNLWRLPNENEDWYNYDEQKWANAVVLGKGKTKKPGETVKVDGTEALMMLVYIPRYEYKIEEPYGKGGTDAEHPGEIEVNFILKDKTIPTDGYHINDAFTFDGEKAGFWVGKFEISHTTKSLGTGSTSSDSEAANLNCISETCSESQYLRILPNVPSLRYNNVSNFFYAIKSIENISLFELSSMDTHMMKNSEWGAVAYLSQSKYGKYGNNDYSDSNKEIYQNKSSTFITGKSNGTPSQSATNTQCSYDDMTNNCGIGASTTGNIYGVYDMSGGSWEFVMGVYGDSDGIYSGYNDSINSGFKGRTGYDNGNIENGAKVPDSKYYNMYLNSTNSNANDGAESCNNNGTLGICYGHAISEIKGSSTNMGWYTDSNIMVYSNNPWFICGGTYNTNAVAGVFSRIGVDGKGNILDSARFVGFMK